MKITDKDERASKGYDDKKEFTCVCCGKVVFLTKFASAKTARCPECKSAGKQVNKDLIPADTPKPKAEISGNTKILPCTNCGTMTEVSKFMSANKVLCDECKGGKEIMPSRLKIDISKIDENTMPSVEDYTILPSNIANPRLRNVQCPACGEPHMRILQIMDYSSFGLIINYQCNKCNLLVNISEQCNFRCKTHKVGSLYDYSGHEIDDLIDSVKNTRIHGTISKLYEIIKEHNIQLEGIELPPYLYEEDKPVPIGFEISQDDKWIKTIDDIIQVLNKSERIGSDVDMPEGARYIAISDTLAKQLSSRLKQLLITKEE